MIKQVLAEIDDERLRVDFVWTPIWSIDNLSAANMFMPISPDPRARVWWDQFNQLSDGLSPFMFGLNPVWDVYLLYETERLLLVGAPHEVAYAAPPPTDPPEWWSARDARDTATAAALRAPHPGRVAPTVVLTRPPPPAPP